MRPDALEPDGRKGRIALRRATCDDAAALADLFVASRRAAMPWLAEVYSPEQTRHWMKETVLAEATVLSTASDPILGFVAARPGLLEHLYVAPASRRLGIGTRLLRAAMDASDGRLQLLVFQRNIAARMFYEQHGFSMQALRDGSDNEEGEPDAVYVWQRSA